MAPLEPWEKALVDSESFPTTVHGEIACTECHQGDAQAADKAEAHTDLIGRPSDQPEVACGECHPDVVSMNEFSLHSTLAGYWTVLNERSVPENHDQLSEMFGNHCNSCHTSCGDCHVSQPASVGGGFVDGHNFNAQPSMTQNCTACHGSRVGNEYLGKHEGIQADVHFRQGRMVCTDCHGSHEMHGQPADCLSCHEGPEEAQIPPPDHRYDGAQTPRCETCHITAATGQDGQEMHQTHGGDLSCQVCHSMAYTSCDNCHVQVSETTGNPFFTTDATYMGFWIGLNPERSYERPYEYVPLRHVPAAPDAFSFYGDNLLPNFDARPTWAYATPHNIQLVTPQAESCDACHGHAEWFLTGDKVAESEQAANAAVIMAGIPLPIDTITATETLTETGVITTTGTITTTGGITTTEVITPTEQTP